MSERKECLRTGIWEFICCRSFLSAPSSDIPEVIFHLLFESTSWLLYDSPVRGGLHPPDLEVDMNFMDRTPLILRILPRISRSRWFGPLAMNTSMHCPFSRCRG